LNLQGYQDTTFQKGENLMQTFQAKRTIKSYTQHLKATPAQIFPLLCPVREYDWIEHWNCKLIYTDSGVIEDNCIFTTNSPKDGSEEVWVVSHYEKDKEVQFVRVNDRKATRYDISLTENGDGTTTAVWKQVVTGLNEQGNTFVEQYTDENYANHIKTLEIMLNHFLTTGEMLKEVVSSKDE
jgi:hypothetical protein